MLVCKSSGGHFRFTLKRSEQQSTSQNTARINWWRTGSRLLASASICVRSVVTTDSSYLQNDCTYVLQTTAPYPNVNLLTSNAAYQIEWSLQSDVIKLNPVVKFLFYWNFLFLFLSVHRIISSLLRSLVSFCLLPSVIQKFHHFSALLGFYTSAQTKTRPDSKSLVPLHPDSDVNCPKFSWSFLIILGECWDGV